jgi:hypothetical protein
LLVEASERYVEASRLTGFKGDKQVQVQAQKDAARELEKLLPRIPSLIVAVARGTGEAPAAMLDGKPIPAPLLGEEQPVNPGTHEIKVSWGAVQTERRVTLREAEKKRELIEPPASGDGTGLGDGAAAPAGPNPTPVDQPGPVTRDTPPSSASSSSKTLAYVALAAGGAGLVVGGITGALALGKRSDLEKNPSCAGDVCLPSQRSEVKSLDTLRTVSTVGFVAGAALAATGVVLLLSSHSESQARAHAPRLALHVAPQGVWLTGAFQ